MSLPDGSAVTTLRRLIRLSGMSTARIGLSVGLGALAIGFGVALMSAGTAVDEELRT